MMRLSDMERIVFNLEMLADWHIGSGYGRPGDVDALVARDDHGLPYVPAKTLTGILRDACEQVAYGLDDGYPAGSWSAWVTYVFGSQPSAKDAAPVHRPVAAALSVRPACFPDGIRSELVKASETDAEWGSALRQAVTFIKPGVSLDAQTGQSVEKCLRMVEMARGGVVLHADAQLSVSGLSSEQRHCALALLAAGCRLVERIGGKRRRGSGRVAVSMSAVDVDEKEEIEWIAARAAEIPLPPEPSAEAILPVLDAADAPRKWSEYDLILTLETPVIARSVRKGNIVESLDYLPGTYLLPAVTRALNESHVDAATAVASGTVLVSNATVDVGGRRGLPCPWALFKEKMPTGEQQVLVNVLRQPMDGKKQYKGMRSGYVFWNGGQCACRAVDRVARTHNTIDDERQRPDEDIGVFTYVAIRPGQTFRARVRIADDVAVPDGWEKLLIGTALRLGSSRKDDYGAARVSDMRRVEDEAPVVRSDVLTVWLTSDVLLRNGRLRQDGTPDMLRRALAQELGCTLAVPDSPDGDRISLNCAGRRHRTDSWQAAWGLPRPSLVGLCAGTSLIYSIRDVQDQPRFAAALVRLQHDGVGERRAEGYGQILFNSSLLDMKTVELVEPDKVQQTPGAAPEGTMSEGDREYWRILESALMTAELRKAATKLAVCAEDRRRRVLGIMADKPTDSQLGNLRSMAATLAQPGDAVIMAWVNHGTGTAKGQKDPIADKWGKEAKQKLKDLFGNQATVWNLLFAEGTWQRELAARSGMDRDPKIWVEAVQTLLDQCIRFEKRDREKALKQNKGGRDHGA